MPQPPRTLDDFVTYYHVNQSGNRSLLDWMARAYDGVFPITFEDRDLWQFISVIYWAVRYFRPVNVVQTGTFVGTSSLAIAKSFEDNRRGALYTIDPEPPSYFGIDNPVDIARRAVSQARMQDRVFFIKGYSTVPNDGRRQQLIPGQHWRLTEVGKKIGYDMLVIDGDHTFPGCLNDLYYGAAGLREQGPRLIVVHDYLGIPDVKAAVRRSKSFLASSEIKIVPSPCGIALIRLN